MLINLIVVWKMVKKAAPYVHENVHENVYIVLPFSCFKVGTIINNNVTSSIYIVEWHLYIVLPFSCFKVDTNYNTNVTV